MPRYRVEFFFIPVGAVMELAVFLARSCATRAREEQP